LLGRPIVVFGVANFAAMRLLIVLLFSAATCMASAKALQPEMPQRAFVSGHSLIDNPIPPYLARIAASLGPPLQWNRQYVVGSAIRYRTRGRDRETGWEGYVGGYNREGQGLNVIEEFRRPRTTDGMPYDTLIITEQNGVLDSIVLQDTVRHLRHYHDRFIDGNPKGRTWFYESWMGVIDKAKPARWIAYERSAAPLWQCVVTRINTSLAAEGRADRIESLPASLALVALVEKALRGEVAGLAAGDTRHTLDQFFQDEVHLKPLASYYIALSAYAAIYDRAPSGAWAPEGVNPQLAASLQRVAWEAVSAERTTRTPLPLGQCAAYMNQFKGTYFDHTADDYWNHLGNPVNATYQRLRHRLQWRWRLWRDFDDDPFRYDPNTDKAHWLPAP
jgi:hypothetical protein